jgi:hypothetical protein
VIVALVAAVVASIGDFILLAAANAGNAAFDWIPTPSDRALLIGTYLGLLTIPCYAFGYRTAAHKLEDAYGRWFLRLGLAAAVLGGTTHALTGLTIHLGRAKGLSGSDFAAVLAPAGTYLVPIWVMLAMAAIAASYFFAAGVLRGRSSLPRWTAPANPIVLILAISLLAAPFAFGRVFVVPAAPNLAHVLFFGILVVLPHRDPTAMQRTL